MKLKSLSVLLFAVLTGSISAVSQQLPHECTNPIHYNARNWPREKVQKLFDECDPADADIWYGKKERISLNGVWKTRLIELKADRRTTVMLKVYHWADRWKRAFHESLVGEKRGFYKPDYDDSKWYYTIVPSLFNVGLGENLGEGMIMPFRGLTTHEVWYRRDFTIPKKWKGKRLILTFEYLSYKGDVYLNGKKIASHTNSFKGHWTVFQDALDESFDVDITDGVKYGEKNQITVKVHSHFEHGGFSLPAYIDAYPPIYADKVFITPDRKAKAIHLRAFFNNTTGKSHQFDPLVELAPWKSKNYHLANWTVEKTKLPATVLPPGKSEWTATVPMKEIHYWNMEEPNLYHFRLFDGKTLVNQERFGFRTFEVGENAFLLNGKPVFLRGYICSLLPSTTALYHQLGILNKKNNVRIFLQRLKDMNYNFLRIHRVFCPEYYRNLGDELGFAFYEEAYGCATRGKDGKYCLDPEDEKRLLRLIRNNYNSPALVMRASLNEAYDNKVLNKLDWPRGVQPILDCNYDFFKKWDPTRPFCGSSGRHSTGHYGPAHAERFNCKNDFWDDHIYPGANEQFVRENPELLWSFRSSKEMFEKAYGKKQAFLNSEWGSPLSAEPPNVRENRWSKILRQHMKNGEFDRKWLAKNGNFLNNASYVSSRWAWAPKAIIATDFITTQTILGRQIKMATEMIRRNKDHISGEIVLALFDMHPYGRKREKDHFKGSINPIIDSYKIESPEAFYTCFTDQMTMGQQPVIAAADKLFPYNLITGSTIKSHIVLMNETFKTLPASEIVVAINGKAMKTFKTEPLEQNGLRKLRLNGTVPDLPTGNGKLSMTVLVNGKKISYNEYLVYILNKNDIPLPKQQRAPVVLLGKNYSMIKVLDALKVPYTITDGMPKLNEIAVYTGSSSRKQTEQLIQWVQNGGKAIMLNTENLPHGLPGIPEDSPYNAVSEIVLHKHPVFNGLGDENFIFWKGKHIREVFSKGLYPMHEGVLMFRAGNNNHTIMTMGEVKIGKGRIFFTYLYLQEMFGKDACATKTMCNLMDYVTTGFNDPNAPMIQPVGEKVIRSYDIRGMVPTFIDLTKVVNMGLTDEKAEDKKGGWSDQGKWNNDGSCIKPGLCVAAGVPFQIIDEKKNQGKACLVLKGGPVTKMDFVPSISKPVVLMKHANRLYFLLTSKWTPNKKEFGYIEITKSLSTGVGTIQKDRIPLIGNVNVGDWWYGQGGTAVPGLTYDNNMGGIYSTYVIEWIDPEPQNIVSEIRFVCNGRTGYPIILAVTAMNEPAKKGKK